MAWFDGVPFTPHVLEMVYDPGLKPHYGWLFPESPVRVNIGICLFADRLRGRSVRDIFQGFLETHFGKRLAGADQVGRWKGHPISTTASVSHTAPPGVLKIGEANRLTNIATGEGISYTLESGLLAIRAIRTGESGGWDAPGIAGLICGVSCGCKPDDGNQGDEEIMTGPIDTEVEAQAVHYQ